MDKKKLKKDEYRCEVCGGVFQKGRSDEEAIAEKEKLFSDVPLEDCGIVCDDCFKAMDKEFGFTKS